MGAQHALVDPLLTLGLPPAATMQTGMDALAQAIGGVIVRNGNPGSVALGLEACGNVPRGSAPPWPMEATAPPARSSAWPASWPAWR